jgi:uncharacterized membrane protein YadS
VPGLALAAVVGVVATAAGHVVPLVGTAVPGAVIGVAVALALTAAPTIAARRTAALPNAAPRIAAAGEGIAAGEGVAAGEARAAGKRDAVALRARLAPGLKVASTRLLQCSVVILGAQLSLTEAARVGLSSLPVMLGTLAVCLGAAFAYGRLLGVVGDLRTLIGVGTGICGASAIAAVTPVIEATSTDVAYAVSTIFLFNIAAVLAFPILGHALGMSQHSFGLFAGTAVNDTSSVVATAATYGNSAAGYAVVVKLVRTLMIIPVCVGLGALTARRKASATATGANTAPGGAGVIVSPAGPAALAGPAVPAAGARVGPRKALRLVPWFLIGFVVMAAANSAALIPATWHGPLSQLSLFLVAMALSAIGLSTDVAALRRAGAKPLLLGAMLWVTVATASLGLQFLTGSLH